MKSTGSAMTECIIIIICMQPTKYPLIQPTIPHRPPACHHLCIQPLEQYKDLVNATNCMNAWTKHHVNYVFWMRYLTTESAAGANNNNSSNNSLRSRSQTTRRRHRRMLRCPYPTSPADGPAVPHYTLNRAIMCVVIVISTTTTISCRCPYCNG